MDNNGLEANLLQLRKELRATRIFGMISAFMLCVLLAGGIFMYGQVKQIFELVEETNPIVEEMANLDMDNVNLALERISYTLGSVDWQQVSDAIGSVDWQEVSDSIGELDVDAINDAIEGLDTQELSEAIERLNNVAEMLEGWKDKLGSYTGWFGN